MEGLYSSRLNSTLVRKQELLEETALNCFSDFLSEKDIAVEVEKDSSSVSSREFILLDSEDDSGNDVIAAESPNVGRSKSSRRRRCVQKRSEVTSITSSTNSDSAVQSDIICLSSDDAERAEDSWLSDSFRQNVFDSPLKELEQCSQADLGSHALLKVNMGGSIYRYSSKDTCYIVEIIKDLAVKEKVAEHRLHLYLGDKFIWPYQTLSSLNLAITDILESHIMDAFDLPEIEKGDTTLMIQHKGSRKRLPIVVSQTDVVLKVAYLYLIKARLTWPLLSVSCIMDGEVINMGSTISEAQLEDEDCVDIITSGS